MYSRTLRVPLWSLILSFLLALLLVLTTPWNLGSLLGTGNAAEGEVKVVDTDEPDKDYDEDPHAPCEFKLRFTGFSPDTDVDWNIESHGQMTPAGEELD